MCIRSFILCLLLLPLTAHTLSWKGLKQLSLSPSMYIIPNFVSDTEIQSIFQILGSFHWRRKRSCWEPQAEGHDTCMLEGRPDIAFSSIFTLIDERLSALTGFSLDQIEDGYLQRYSSSFAMHNLHLDQNPSHMQPRRMLSVLIYLDTQPSPLSGATVFPLITFLNSTSPVPSSTSSSSRGIENEDSEFSASPHPWSLEKLESVIGEWDAKLEQGHVDMQERDFFAQGRGANIFRLAEDMCAAGHGVHPQRGSLLLFYNFDDNEKETIRGIHGSCPLPIGAPTKHVLVKMLCDGKVRSVPKREI